MLKVMHRLGKSKSKLAAENCVQNLSADPGQRPLRCAALRICLMHLDQPRHPALPSSGLRRVTLPMLDTQKAADTFKGLTGETHGNVLAAFKAAASFLGFRMDIVFAIDWLFKFTQPQDWGPGARPIVWPSAANQQAAFGLSETQVKCLNRRLAEQGLIIMRDSPNGRRFGLRTLGKTGAIIEAYGFDLSPLAVRMAEFRAIAAAGKARQHRIKRLRRRAAIARNGLRQIIETASVEVVPGFDRLGWQERTVLASRGVANITDEAELTMTVATLERLRDEARDAAQQCFAAALAEQKLVETDPKGPENRPQFTTTNELQNPSDTVMAHGPSSSGLAGSSSPKDEPPTRLQRRVLGKPIHELETVGAIPIFDLEKAALNLTPEELTKLAPKLGTYLASPVRTWADVLDAADLLRAHLGISVPLWGDACLTLGRRSAAVAVAILSTKPSEHFRAGPGAYLFGMVRRAKSGELNLGRTIWGLRRKLKINASAAAGPPTLSHSFHG
jgi:replication initiation protein RepC